DSAVSAAAVAGSPPSSLAHPAARRAAVRVIHTHPHRCALLRRPATPGPVSATIVLLLPPPPAREGGGLRGSCDHVLGDLNNTRRLSGTSLSGPGARVLHPCPARPIRHATPPARPG